MDDIQVFRVDRLEVRIYPDARMLAVAAAERARAELQARREEQGRARVVLATGNSQKQLLEILTEAGAIAGAGVTFFHLDEYIGLGPEHPASFQHYLRQRVENRLPTAQFHYLRSDAPDPAAECQRYAQLLQEAPLDLCFLGIGDNGHLAFNEPEVADFNDPQRVKIVPLDAMTRQQQVKSGSFPTLDAVPPAAMTLTLSTICACKRIFCLAPGENKAKIVKTLLQGAIAPICPASVLRTQPQALLFLDAAAASLL